MKKGFTLIELLAVIVIIAIISTIGIYSVTKLINKSRLNSLTDTAFAVRKAANLYVASHPDVILPKELYMTPGADDAHLLNLGKDPWGKDYESVIAEINKVNDKYRITVFIKLINKTYYLDPDATKLKELKLLALSLSGPSEQQSNLEAIINYKVPKIVEFDNVSLIIKKDGNPANTPADYVVAAPISLTPINSDGFYNNYQVGINLKTTGEYQVQIQLHDGATNSDLSSPLNISIFNVLSLQYIQLYTHYNEWDDWWSGTKYAIKFKITNLKSDRTLKATIQRWTAFNTWETITTDKTILPDVEYIIREGDVLGQNLTNLHYASYIMYSSNPCWDTGYSNECWFDYKFRLIATDGVTTLTPTDLSYRDNFYGE